MAGPLFADIPSNLRDELFTTLLHTDGVRIERIVSTGQSSPAEHWYDQEDDEWVVVLRGAARLRFEDRVLEMRPGDFVNIRAHERHRVDWTSPDEPTVWLAVFYRKSG